MTIKLTKTVRGPGCCKSVIGPVALEFSIEGKYTHVIRENLLDQQIDGGSSKVTRSGRG